MKNKIDLKTSWELREKAEIERLRASLEKNAKDPSLHYEIGRILMRRWGSKEREWGIKHLEQAVKFKRDFAEAFELLAIEATDTDHNKAIRLYKKAANIYASQDNKEKAKELLNEAAMLVVYEGWEFLNARDTITAKKKAQRALSIFPHCIDAKNILASIHMDRFEFIEAERIYKEAIQDAVAQQGGKIKIDGVPYWGELDTRPYMRARHARGLCYVHLEKFQDALNEFKTLLDLNPNDNQGIRFLLADVYFYLGDKKKAEKYYKEYGEHEGAYNYALFLFSMKEKSKAINLLKESIKAVPFVAIMLMAYLKMFKFWQEKGLFNFGETPPLFMHRNAVINAWNENIKLAKDYITNRNLEAAYDFCNLYGPLWLRQKSSYTFLLEGMDATT
jgi:tetratricopeptide (TPR) repeat protein